MNERMVHDFGIVDDKGDIYEFHLESDSGGQCRLEFIVQTERGPRRNEIASIPVTLWNAVGDRAIRELAEGMGENERLKKAPNLKNGMNRLSPLIGRELAVLLWALMETDRGGNIEAILHGWRELAREERWWLYAKGAAPGQRSGAGWRRALFHALSETPESRTVDPMPVKKKPWECLPICHDICEKEDAGEKSMSHKPAGADPVDTTESGQEKESAHEPTNGRPESELGKKSGLNGGHIQLELF